MPHPETIDTYNQAAVPMAEYFAGIGPRTALIEKGLELVGNPEDARVVEIGCGDGRDASNIVPRVGWYEGFDPSEGLLDLARQRQLENASFVRADALSYDYPKNLDVVYAFASFLHLDAKDFAAACQKVDAALKMGGILLMTLKAGDAYRQKLVEDQFGRRMFYFYNEPTVRRLAGDLFEFAYVEHERIQSTDWMYLGLRKR